MSKVISDLTIGLLSQPIILLIIIGCLLSAIFYKKIVGYAGEFWVKMELMKLSKEKYLVLNDIMLETTTGTHQIDHIVVSKFGIFVIETKQYMGLITGDDYQEKWVQHFGKNRYYFNNPIHQNYGHVLALKEVLKLPGDLFIPIVIFSNKAKIKINTKNLVVNLNFLLDEIKKYNNEIINDLASIKDIIQKYNVTDKNKRKTHVKTIMTKIKEIKEKEDNMVCPKCNGQLIERKGKYGKFVGCSNYPKCLYIKK